jgi:hypothetical protein
MASNNFNTSKSNSAGIIIAQTTSNGAGQSPKDNPSGPKKQEATIGGKLGSMAGNLPASGGDTEKK